jgi:drug/metabolite transporter (DMT)-like permease
MWTAILAYLFLKERISPYDWGAVFLTILGVFVIENPFSSKTHSEDHSALTETVGVVAALVGAIFTATAMMFMRKLG